MKIGQPAAFVVRKVKNKGYSQAGASYEKRSLKGFLASSGSAQEDIDFNNYTLRQRARILYMASPLATSAIKTNRTNVIGSGLRLKAKIDRELLGMDEETAYKWQRNAEKEFALWAENRHACDITGLNDFYEMQQLALMAWLTSGDVFAVFKWQEQSPANPYNTCLHIIEADRVATPTEAKNGKFRLYTEGTNEENGNKIHDGVEVDAAGKVVAYWIRSTYPLSMLDFSQTEWTRIEALGKDTGLPNILHIMESERPDQYRGVTFLAQVIEPLLQIRRYTESELTAAIIESFFTAWIKTEANTDTPPMGEAGPDGMDPVPRGENDFHMGPGTAHILKPGEDVVFGEPKRPASGFGNFVRVLAEEVGAALEVPADILLKSFNSSYSASRGALLEAWKAFKMRRTWFSNDFCKPVYEQWLAEAVAKGRIQAPGFFGDPLIRKAWSGSEWNGPGQGTLNPVQEVQAEVLACQNGMSTREQSTVRLNGGDYNANVEALSRENAQLQLAAYKED